MPEGYTDFNVKLPGKEIVFRHSAKSVREFLSLEDDIIYDVYGVKAIKKREIISVELNPIPFAIGYMVAHQRQPKNMTDMWEWVHKTGYDPYKNE